MDIGIQAVAGLLIAGCLICLDVFVCNSNAEEACWRSSSVSGTDATYLIRGDSDYRLESAEAAVKFAKDNGLVLCGFESDKP